MAIADVNAGIDDGVASTSAAQAVRSPRPGAAAEDSRESASGRRRDKAPSDASLMDLLRSLWRDVPGLVSDRVHLAAVELRAARRALVQMAGMAIIAGILAATAWVALWVLAAAAAVAIGMHWSAALILVVLLNVGGAWFALQRAKSLVSYLSLPATVRRLTMMPPSPSPSPSATAEAADNAEPRANGPGASRP